MAKKRAFDSLTLRARPRKSPMPDVTPLVNVALVLLIVFMVVMPIIQEGIRVDTPEAVNLTEINEQGQEHVVISCKSDGSLYLNMREVPLEGLREELARVYRGKEHLPVVIKGARNRPYSDILQLIEICQNAGASGVELIARKRKGGG